MLTVCQIYFFDGVELSDAFCRECKILKTNAMGLLSLFDRYSRVIRIKKDKVVIGDSRDIREEILKQVSSEKIFFYKDERTYIELLEAEVSYGILYDNNLICLYEKENVRNAKFNYACSQGIDALLNDIEKSKELITKIAYQKEYREACQKIKRRI